MATNGFWLGGRNRHFPLLVANGGFGTAKYAQNNNTQFLCINNIQKRQDTFAIDNNLCWGPIGTLSLLVNELWGVFVEYNSYDSILGASINMGASLPLRLTWGVNFAQQNDLLPSSQWNWVFRASFGF